MLKAQNIAQSLELLRKNGTKIGDRPSAFGAVAKDYNRILEGIESLNAKLVDLIDKNYDFLCEELLSGEDLETILSLSFESDYISVSSNIFRSYGMYFFSGTDLDDLGPHETAEGAFYEAEVFLSERDEPFAEIYASKNCPRDLIISTLHAIRKCEQITLKGPDFKISLGG